MATYSKIMQKGIDLHSESKEYKNEILKTLILLALPTMAEEVLHTLLLYVDTAMVGHLGEKATAAVSCTTTITWLVSCVPHSISVLFLALIARNCGAGNRKETKRLSGQALSMSLAAGIFMTVLCIALSPYIPIWMHAEEDVQPNATMYFAILSVSYLFRTLNISFGAALRAVKDTKTPMLINLGENISNVFLNAVFIYVLKLGVPGAAMASSISYIISGVLMVLCARKNDLLKFTLPDLKLDRGILNNFANIGLPALLTTVASCSGHVVFAGMVSGMGTTVFAAHSLAVTAEELFYIPGYGLRMATSSLIGNAIGEADERKRKAVEKQSIHLTVALMCLTGVTLYLIANPIMRLFTPVDEVVVLGAMMLRIVAFTEPFYGLMIVVEGIFYGAGRTKSILAVETFSMWCIRIVFTYLCTHVWGCTLQEIWYCMIADNIFKAVVLYGIYRLRKHYPNC